MKLSTANYYKQTPKKMRKLGDGLLGLSTLLTSYAIIDEWGKCIQITSMVLGVLGKILTNFFSDE
jgi:hypothetical protein